MNECDCETWPGKCPYCGKEGFYVSDIRTHAQETQRSGIYIASKVRHAEKWKALRAKGFPIISTWIDEAGEGESADLDDLWTRCISEASCCRVLVVYREPDDILKGGWVEVGAALAAGVPVYAVGLDGFTISKHKRLKHFSNVEDALSAASWDCVQPQTLAAPPAEIQTEKPVSYRWRQPGNKHWIYDPTPEWIEDHRHEIELEPLYNAPSRSPAVKADEDPTQTVLDAIHSSDYDCIGEDGDQSGTHAGYRHKGNRLSQPESIVQKIEAEARRYAGMYPQSSDGRNTFVIFADLVASLAVSSTEGRDV